MTLVEVADSLVTFGRQRDWPDALLRSMWHSRICKASWRSIEKARVDLCARRIRFKSYWLIWRQKLCRTARRI